MKEEDRLNLDVRFASFAAAHTYAIMAVIGALLEREAIDPARIIAWVDCFARGFDADASHPGNAQAAQTLRAFSQALEKMCSHPEGAGRA